MLYALKNERNIITFDKQNYVLTTVDWGAIDGSHATAKGMGQIGERVAYTALDTREIEIVGHIKANSAEEMEVKKAALYQMCDPRHPFFAMPDGATQLECYALNTPRFAVRKLLNNARAAQFTINAAAYDPLFRDAEQRFKKISEWRSNFTWPLVIPAEGFTFADHTESLITTLTNSGDTETGLMVEFAAEAAVENPTLTNLDTGEFIKLNRTLEAGETVIVNTNYGQESVISYIGDTITNVINDFDLDSTFLQAPVGTTTFRYDADENVNSMTVTVRYCQTYLGV